MRHIEILTVKYFIVYKVRKHNQLDDENTFTCLLTIYDNFCEVEQDTDYKERGANYI